MVFATGSEIDQVGAVSVSLEIFHYKNPGYLSILCSLLRQTVLSCERYGFLSVFPGYRSPPLCAGGNPSPVIRFFKELFSSDHRCDLLSFRLSERRAFVERERTANIQLLGDASQGVLV